MKYSSHRKYVNYQNYQNLMLLTSSVNWFQYVRRVYATAINFSCIITLIGHRLFRIFDLIILGGVELRLLFYSLKTREIFIIS